jgi:hypothetical protein
MWKEFCSDSALCRIAKSFSRISLRIRSHMQKYFKPLNSDPSGIDWVKKTKGRKSRETVPLIDYLLVYNVSKNSPHALNQCSGSGRFSSGSGSGRFLYGSGSDFQIGQVRILAHKNLVQTITNPKFLA